MARYVRPPGGNGEGPRGGQRPETWGWSEDHPALWEFLTLTEHESGVPRATSTLTLFVDEGRLKAVLRDRDASQALFATGATVEALLGSLEAMLADPLADWRPDRKQGNRR